MKKYININFFVTTILAVIIFLINIKNIAILNGPYMFNDELGYLGNAAALAGKDWHETMQSCGWYSYGWSIILVPLFLIFSKMQIIYKCINVLNALLVVGVFLMQRHLLQKSFGEIDYNILTAISAGICFYPSVLVNSNMAWSEIWLLFVFTVITVFLYYMIQNPQTYKSAIFGTLLYYFFVCHNRMIAVVIAGIVVFVGLIFTRLMKRKDGLFFFGALIFSAALFAFVKSYLISKNWPLRPPGGNNIGGGLSALKNLLTLPGLENFTRILLSQFFYICVASYGLIPLGIYASICKIIQSVKKNKIKEILLEIWLILAFLGAFAISTISTGGTPDISNYRLDHIFYGRYFEPIAITILPYGFLYLIKSQTNKVDLSTYKKGYILIVGICSLVAYNTICQLNGASFNTTCASGIAIYVEKFGSSIYFVFPAALFNIVWIMFFMKMFNHKDMSKYVAVCFFASACLIVAHSAEKITIQSQERFGRNTQLIDTILIHNSVDLPIYMRSDGIRGSYYQCMLPNIPLKTAKAHSLTAIQDEKYYIIISSEALATQEFDAYSEIIAYSNEDCFLYVDKTLERPYIFDYILTDAWNFSKVGFSGQWVSENEATIACYLPCDDYQLIVNVGSFPLDELGLDNYTADIYINDIYFDNIVITSNKREGLYWFDIPKEYMQEGDNTVSIRCKQLWSSTDYGSTDSRTLGIFVERLVFRRQSQREFIYDYAPTDVWSFDIVGFSNLESTGRWTSENEAAIVCYLPSDDYQMTVDVASVPLKELGLNDYTANIYINDIYLGDIVIIPGSEGGSYRFDIPKEYMQEGSNTLSINCEQLWSPADYGSSDSRTLGIFVYRVLFTSVDQ